MVDKDECIKPGFCPFSTESEGARKHKIYKKKLEKVAISTQCNLKTARRRASRSGLFFWPNLYCARTRTAIFRAATIE